MIELLFSPSGRINRLNWWLGQLVLLGIGLPWYILAQYAEPELKTGKVELVIPFLLLSIAILPLYFWIGLMLNIKRFHDRNKSGWWVLFSIIPVVGPLWNFIALGFLSGDLGENDYGDGPGYDLSDEIAQMSAPKQQPVVRSKFVAENEKVESQPRQFPAFGQQPKPMFGGRS